MPSLLVTPAVLQYVMLSGHAFELGNMNEQTPCAEIRSTASQLARLILQLEREIQDDYSRPYRYAAIAHQQLDILADAGDNPALLLSTAPRLLRCADWYLAVLGGILHRQVHQPTTVDHDATTDHEDDDDDDDDDAQSTTTEVLY